MEESADIVIEVAEVLPRHLLRAPEPPPFSVGDRIRHAGEHLPTLPHGVVVDVSRSTLGSQGWDEQMTDEHGDKLWMDAARTQPQCYETIDGFCVVYYEHTPFIITRRTALNWELA